jgi:flagellar biosynthesis anti-sigma factor FlgM
MIIDNSNINPLSTQKPEASQPVEKGSHPVDERSKTEGRDKAELSKQALLLSKARIALDEVPETENDRVQSLRQKIQDGNYTVPIEQLASILVSRLKLDK